MNSIKSSVCVFACVTLLLAALGGVRAAPLEQAEQDDFTDESSNEFDEGPTRSANLVRESSELGEQSELAAGYRNSPDFGPNLHGASHYSPVSPAASSSPTFGASHPLGEDNMNTDDDSDADEADASEVEPTATGANAGPATPMRGHQRAGQRADSRREQAEALRNEQDLRQWSGSADEREESADPADSDAQDSNIANAKLEFTPGDLATAAGHHHHHGHGVHGWLEMGAKTGKKGAFKWHDKHPVGGKGR